MGGGGEWTDDDHRALGKEGLGTERANASVIGQADHFGIGPGIDAWKVMITAGR